MIAIRTKGSWNARILATLGKFWGVLMLVALWQLFISASGFNAIVMPSPLSVLEDIAAAPGLYAVNAAYTVLLAGAGLVAGMTLGVGLAILTWLSRTLAGLLTPLSLVLAATPVVALIPVLARLFGYDIRTVFAIVVVISFFPAFVFTSAGLRSSPAGSDDLFRALGASKFTRLTRLALPSALPEWAIALRLGAANSILAAMVAEFLMGTSGLGHLFQAARADLDMSRALGASLLAATISVTCFLLATKIEAMIRRRWL